MNCIIIDDEMAARSIVSHLCAESGRIQVTEEFDNAIDAIKYLNQNETDLIFWIFICRALPEWTLYKP